jgi:NhaA family Na+:H+ antiporter
MSLFIAMLAFDEAAPVNAAKLGILVASLLAGALAAIILKTFGRGKN